MAQTVLLCGRSPVMGLATSVFHLRNNVGVLLAHRTLLDIGMSLVLSDGALLAHRTLLDIGMSLVLSDGAHLAHRARIARIWRQVDQARRPECDVACEALIVSPSHAV
jgi:hypothetical protein